MHAASSCVVVSGHERKAPVLVSDRWLACLIACDMGVVRGSNERLRLGLSSVGIARPERVASAYHWAAMHCAASSCSFRCFGRRLQHKP